MHLLADKKSNRAIVVVDAFDGINVYTDDFVVTAGSAPCIDIDQKEVFGDQYSNLSQNKS
jgi:hypothetical protein